MKDVSKSKELSKELFDQLLGFFMEQKSLRSTDTLAMYLALDKLTFLVGSCLLQCESPGVKGDIEMMKGVLRREAAKLAEGML